MIDRFSRIGDVVWLLPVICVCVGGRWPEPSCGSSDDSTQDQMEFVAVLVDFNPYIQISISVCLFIGLLCDGVVHPPTGKNKAR